MAQAAYITLEEAAELEKISYDTMQKRCKRGNADTKIIPQESGGRPLVLVAVIPYPGWHRTPRQSVTD